MVSVVKLYAENINRISCFVFYFFVKYYRNVLPRVMIAFVYHGKFHLKKCNPYQNNQSNIAYLLDYLIYLK